MTFLYFWLVCGLVALILHIVDECRQGKVLMIAASCKDLIWAAVFGPVGLVAMIGIWFEIIIAGRGK